MKKILQIASLIKFDDKNRGGKFKGKEERVKWRSESEY